MYKFLFHDVDILWLTNRTGSRNPDWILYCIVNNFILVSFLNVNSIHKTNTTSHINTISNSSLKRIYTSFFVDHVAQLMECYIDHIFYDTQVQKG